MKTHGPMTIEEKAIAFAESYKLNGAVCTTKALLHIVEKSYLAGATEALASQWISVEDELPEDNRESINTGISLILKEDFIVYSEYEDGSFDHFVVNRKKFEWSQWLWWDSENDYAISNVLFWMPIAKPLKPDKQ